MGTTPEMNRRTLLRAGLAVSAVGAAGFAVPALAGATDTATRPRVAAPTIATCADWGARPANGTIEILNHKPTYIVVHHTAGSNSADLTKEHAFQVAQDIQNLHMDTNGWIDTGQQLTNSRGGFVMEGRHKSLQVLRGGTQHVMGANVANHNSDIIGIENEGLYTNVDVTPQLWNSLVNLVAYIADQYGIAPELIKGHRDFNNTECPGDVLYARLPELRSAVGGVLGVSVTPQAVWPLLKPGGTGSRVVAAQHLLRAAGSTVGTDGVYGPSTEKAVRQFATAHKIPFEPCYASTKTPDETGFLGAATWPLLVRTVKPGDTGEAADAVKALQRGRRAAQVVDTRTWQELLSQ
jgi:hypothetical protein